MKDQELEKLNSDLNHLTFMNRNPQSRQKDTGNNVELLNHQLRDKLADTEGKLKLLLKMTEKFLHSMKKLQKAVHRKEQNVHKKKNDFESLRKELEVVLANLL